MSQHRQNYTPPQRNLPRARTMLLALLDYGLAVAIAVALAWVSVEWWFMDSCQLAVGCT